MADTILRVGIGGYGRSGRDIHTRWLKQVPERFKIVAVADQIPARRRDARQELGCATFNDYRDLLRKADIDLFITALPSLLHSAGTVEAFRAGRHAVCEKPIGTNVKEFDAMVAASRKARRHFLPFQNSRFFPFFRKMREVIDSGVLGDVVQIRSVWGGFGRRWDWQTLRKFGGGNLLNTGPHPMDHAIMLFGNRQPKVFCRMKSIQPFGGTAEDFCAVTLYGPKAPVIEILLNSYLVYPLGDQYNISATFGGMAGGSGGLRWKYFDPRKAPRQKLWKPWSLNRGYCGETLPWVEETWQPPEEAKDAFQYNSRCFYENVYDVIVKRAEQVVKPAEVRRQIIAIEECHRQNPRAGRE
ncbi:MAG: hypothetical protein A2340_11090 [Lentisphaerae bacterium RIFOXYB12_FULL_60_10]|nr:MAG: hypothetical protein A2269_05255 [Lentisphaerae bacterium RIFOXYA12_FULL_60_10]OGV77723.1 MAG: hypothetical protein A2340_11090 [Lentisphaerae bacterium RIFOXYB12_FULL_60_10]